MAESLDPGRFDFEKLFAVPAGSELPSDAPNDDRTDAALKSRSESFQKADDLNWLVEGTDTPQPQQAKPEAPTEDAPGILGAAAWDVGMGATEAPRQVAGGMRDAVQSILDLSDELPSLGGLTFTDEQGNFSLDYRPPAEWEALQAKDKIDEVALPDVAQPQTVTGDVVRNVSQFLTGFGLAGKALGGLRGATKVGTAVRAAGAGSIADFAAFEGQTERLSNLVQSIPALANPVTEFLAADPGDSEVEGRLKNAVEGLGLGAASSAVFKGLRAYRAVRNVQRQAGSAQRVADVFRFADEEQTLREAGEMALIGRATNSAPLVVKADRALAETEAGVPTDVAARALTTRGLTPMNAAGDVYVNFAKINTPEDIQRIIKDTSSAFSPSIEEARRGVRSNAQTLLSAADVDAWDALMTRRTGQALNAEQSVAARELWASAADKLGQVANLAAENPAPENLFQFRRMLATFHAIQKEVIGARTETARALQSWAMPVGGNLERMRNITEALQTGGGIEESADLARRFAQASRLDGGKSVMSKLAEKTFAQKALGSVQEYWINALLSNPKTHVVNVLSNTGVVGMGMLERGVAARLGRVFSEEAGVEVGEAAAMLAGLRGGILDGFRNAGKALRTGQEGFGLNKVEMPRQRAISSGSWNVRSKSWLGMGIDGLGAVVNVPGKMLQAEDEFFKTVGYRSELHAQAQRIVSREIREGRTPFRDAKARIAQVLDDPPEAIRMEAVAHAAYQTFTSEPGKFVRGFQKILGQAPILKFVVPFVNTPANILKYTFERTPLAPLTGRYRAAIAQGGAAADLARTRMALGTMGLLYAIDLGMHGATTGSGPGDNPSEMQNWRRQGNQPYAVKFGDTQIAYNRLDPLGYHLGIGADLAEYLLNTEPDDATMAEFQEGVAASAFAVAENFTSKSYMEGLSLLMEAINDPKRFSAAYLERFASSFIPAGVAEAARFTDPVQRHSHDIVTSMKRRLPGFSTDLPPRRDLWGRPITWQSGMGEAYDALSPLYGSTYKPEPIDRLMEEDGWFVGAGQNYFKIEGETVSLKNDPRVLSRFHELRGATKPSAMEADKLLDKYGDFTLLETLNAVVTGQHDLSAEFEEIETADDREDFVKDIVSDYRNAAKDQLFREHPELIERAARKRTLRKQAQPAP